MKFTKKILSAVVACGMLLSSTALTAMAENGPMNEPISVDGDDCYLAYVSAWEMISDGNGNTHSKDYVFFADNTAYSDVYDGISYDIDSNTLFLKNASADGLAFSANVMGDDFKINVSGICSIGRITVYGDGYGGNLTITGTGTLTVNKNKVYQSAITMSAEETAGKLTFSKDVKVNLYARDGADVVQTICTTNANKSDAYVFENGQTANVTKENYTTKEIETINGVYLSEPDRECYGGISVTSADDPDGIYAVTTGYKNNAKDNTLYWVAKYIYLPKFNAYMMDRNYFNGSDNVFYGEKEYTEEEWNDQTNYTIVTVPSGEGAEIAYYDADNLDADYHYSMYHVKRASDPDGLYGYNYYTSETNGVVTKGYYIKHFVTAPNSDKFIVDADFETIYITESDFENSEWSIVEGTEEVYFRWIGDVDTYEYGIYQDSNGNKYATDYDDDVYNYTEGDGVHSSDNFYYYLEKNDDVDFSDLSPVQTPKTWDGIYDYAINSSEFIYTGDGNTHTTHTYDGGKVTKAATYDTTGVMTYTCTVCGSSYTEVILKLIKTSISKATVSGIKDKTYTGSAITQSITVKNGSTTLKSGTDYKVTYKNNTNAGTATVTVTGLGKYTDSVSKTFKITAKKITPTVTLSKTSYVYNGKVQTPSVTVKYGSKTLKKGTDYTVTLASGRKNVGKYNVKITLKGNYSGTKTVSYKILPKATKLSSLTSAKSKTLTVKWSKLTTQTTGYQFQYSTDSKFTKNVKTVTISKNSTTSKIISGLTAKKKYYVRIRTYKTVSGTKYYSAWSAAKNMTVKK